MELRTTLIKEILKIFSIFLSGCIEKSLALNLIGHKKEMLCILGRKTLFSLNIVNIMNKETVK